MCFRKAFTMLELIFAIVIIGILASIAIPKLAATRTDAVISKGKTQVAAIRNGIIIQKGLMLLRGGSGFPNNLDDVNNTGYCTADFRLFVGADDGDILQNALVSNNTAGNWMKRDTTRYRYFITNDINVIFTYDNSNGSFDCNSDDKYCNELTR